MFFEKNFSGRNDVPSFTKNYKSKKEYVNAFFVTSNYLAGKIYSKGDTIFTWNKNFTFIVFLPY